MFLVNPTGNSRIMTVTGILLAGCVPAGNVLLAMWRNKGFFEFKNLVLRCVSDAGVLCTMVDF